jgi:hypothetical protein
MKNFIEVKLLSTGENVLINVKNIRCVVGNVVHLDTQPSRNDLVSYVVTSHTYEEIKKMMEEAYE